MYLRARRGIGYLPQEPSIFRGLTVEQNVLAILETLPLSGAERRQRARELLAELGLTTVAASPAYTLSGGERRRAEITRALVMSPKFILLDEPSLGLSPKFVSLIFDTLVQMKRAGIGVLITTTTCARPQNHRPRIHRDRREHLPQRHAGQPRWRRRG
jgi:lipopolysaccharide export system ATP-binding protein